MPGMQCDGMDVLDTYAVIGEALKQAREERQPVLVEAITYRFRGHSMADPEEYRTKEQVAEWRKHDPIQVFAERLEDEGVLDEGEAEKLDEAVVGRIDEAVTFADKARRSRRPSRSTTTSTSWATRCAAGTRSTSAPPASTAASTSASSPRPSAGRRTSTRRRSTPAGREDVGVEEADRRGAGRGRGRRRGEES